MSICPICRQGFFWISGFLLKKQSSQEEKFRHPRQSMKLKWWRVSFREWGTFWMRQSFFEELHERAPQLGREFPLRFDCPHQRIYPPRLREIKLPFPKPNLWTELQITYHSVGCVPESLKTTFHCSIKPFELIEKVGINGIERMGL